MPKLHNIQTNFSAGEVSPKVLGRVDSPRYKDAAQTLLNCRIGLIGYAERTPGTVFVQNEGNYNVIALPFVLTPGNVGYLIVLKSNGIITFYKNNQRIINAGVFPLPGDPPAPYYIDHPFTADELFEFTWEQKGNEIYFWHANHPPMKLIRHEDIHDNNWELTAIEFASIAVYKVNKATCDNNTDEDLPDEFTIQMEHPHHFKSGMKIRITGADQAAYNGVKSITVTSDQTFTFNQMGGFTTSPATGTISAKIAVASITREDDTATVVCEAAHHLKHDSYVVIEGADQPEYNGTFRISAFAGTPEQFSITVEDEPTTPATGTITVMRKLSVEWSALAGYPAAGTFFEQSMYMGGSASFPLHVWKSVTGEPDNFSLGSGDSDGFAYALAAAKGQIKQLCATRGIFVFESGGEHTIQAGNNQALTPTNVQAKKRQAYGSSNCRPLVFGDSVLFITKNKKQLRSLDFNWEADTYIANDLSLLASHLAEEHIICMASTTFPDPTIYAVMETGNLLTITYEKRGQEMILAWSKNTTAGKYNWVAVIPHDNKDQVWVAVQRTTGGGTYTYIERFEDGRQTHSCKTGTVVEATDTWHGLEHLEGKTVDILADGIPQPQQVVADGQITLERAASTVEIGLHYETIIKDLPPILLLGDGISVGRKISTNKIIVRLHESVGCTINGEEIPFRSVDEDTLDETAIEPFTGDKELTTTGWNDGTVTIRQDQPLPLRVLAIIKQVTITE